jgi:hypothetical protein
MLLVVMFPIGFILELNRHRMVAKGRELDKIICTG